VASFRYRVGSRYVAVVWRLEMICGPQLSAEKNKKYQKRKERYKGMEGRLSLRLHARARFQLGRSGRTFFFFLSFLVCDFYLIFSSFGFRHSILDKRNTEVL
jgi:hypothetical protein